MLGFLGALVAVYVRMLIVLIKVKEHMESMDLELARVVAQVARLENLVLAMLGKAPRNIQDFRQDL